MKVINHGVPNSPYKYIFQPVSDELYSERIKAKPVYTLKDPRTGDISKAQLVDILRVGTHQIPDHMCLVTYGTNSLEAVKLLEAKFPTIKIKRELEILIVKIL